jgi:hypothetical protein
MRGNIPDRTSAVAARAGITDHQSTTAFSCSQSFHVSIALTIERWGGSRGRNRLSAQDRLQSQFARTIARPFRGATIVARADYQSVSMALRATKDDETLAKTHVSRHYFDASTAAALRARKRLGRCFRPCPTSVTGVIGALYDIGRHRLNPHVRA